MNRKIIPVILIITGAAILLGLLLFRLDSLTSTQPKGLGEQIFNALGLLLGAGTSLGGWIGLFRKDKPTESTRIVAMDEAQVATGAGGRNVRTGTYVEKQIIEQPAPTPEVHDTIGFIPPAKVVTYVHRGTIENDIRAFLKNGGTGAIIGLHSPGGLGKTELAKHTSEEMKDHFEGILWVDVGEKKPQQVIGNLLLILGVAIPPGITEAQQKNELHHALQNHRFLIIFDDVREKALAGLNDFLPPKPCSALLTSRIQQIGGVNQTFELDHMTPAQAKELMEAVLGEKTVNAESDAAAKLAERCAFNPLAVEIAARRIRQVQGVRKPIAHYLEMAEARFSQLKMKGDERWDMEYIFDLSYDDLNIEDQKRFRVLSSFHPTGFMPQAAAFLWENNEDETRNALSRFINLSLVKPVPMENEYLERYRLHDLLNEYAGGKLKLEKEEQGTGNKLADWLTGFYNEFYLPDINNLPLGLAEKDNLLKACAHARGYKDGNRLAQLTTRTLNWFNVYFVEHKSEWLAWLEASLQLGIEDTTNEGKRLKANVLQAIGDVQQFREENDAALESYNEALKLFKAVGDRLGEANTLQSLGKMIIMNSEDQLSFDKGMETLQTAMQFYEEINAMAGQINILMFMAQLAESRNQTEKALEIAQVVLPMLIKVAGENHPVTLSFKEFIAHLKP